MCKIASRMIGPWSKLYTHHRAPANVRSAEERRLKEEMNEVDKHPLIILDTVQRSSVEEALKGDQNVIAIEGPPGSGKTIVGLEILLKWMTKKN